MGEEEWVSPHKSSQTHPVKCSVLSGCLLNVSHCTNLNDEGVICSNDITFDTYHLVLFSNKTIDCRRVNKLFATSVYVVIVIVIICIQFLPVQYSRSKTMIMINPRNEVSVCSNKSSAAAIVDRARVLLCLLYTIRTSPITPTDPMNYEDSIHPSDFTFYPPKQSLLLLESSPSLLHPAAIPCLRH